MAPERIAAPVRDNAPPAGPRGIPPAHSRPCPSAAPAAPPGLLETTSERVLDRPAAVFLGSLSAAALGVTVCSLLPSGTLLHLDGYVVSLLGKYLCFALLALSIDLIWGYLGILSLGHGAFFGLGAYVMGMHLMREIGGRGVYGNPVLPDFMVFLNWESLPWYWHGSDNMLFTCLLVVLVPGIAAAAFGRPAFRSRVSGVYFSIITQAVTFALMLAFFRNEMGFGGNNGLTDFKSLLGVSLQSEYMITGLFCASAFALGVAFILCRVIVASRLGRVFVAVRDAESRARFIGYRVENVKLAAFVFSAVLAGLAGALYVPQVGIVNPGVFAPLFSVEMVVCVALGGRGRLYGAVLGALVVNIAKTFFTTALPDVWLFFLGALFVVVTLLLPDGLSGIPDRLRGRLRALQAKSGADA
ncbi:MAG: urea ABC transporter permease subunit UrtC [Desulfovibrio sp.]|jgi:urea transport system permease protein|nr:urea ABC transporter permease subunit UrtC [Desulfovibrio sp.]